MFILVEARLPQQKETAEDTMYRSAIPVPVRAALRTFWRTGRAVPTILSSVLLVASALKIHQLASGAVVADSYLNSPWFRVALIELELCLGLWLLLGFYPRQARFLALACFGAFAAVSLQQALAGRVSCCCFGALAVRPWFTFLFDVAAVGGLWHWRPNPHICAGERREAVFRGRCFR